MSNYFFEVLTETGIIGLFVVMLIALMFILFIVKNFSHLKGNNIEILFLLAGVVSLILATYPIKATGSVFTTNNTTYLILMVSIVLSYQQLLKGKNFK